jgi:hypothetical protein
MSGYAEIRRQLEQISSLNESDIISPEAKGHKISSISLEPEQSVLECDTRKPTPIQTAQLTPRQSPSLLIYPKAHNLIRPISSLRDDQIQSDDESTG